MPVSLYTTHPIKEWQVSAQGWPQEGSRLRTNHHETDPRRRRVTLLWSMTVQAGVILLMVAGYVWQDDVFTRSLLFGGLVVAIPNCWLAWYTYLAWGMKAGSAKKAHRLYRGEIQKLLMTAVLCGAAFVALRPLDAAGFFLAFFILVMLGWMVPAWLLYRMDHS